MPPEVLFDEAAKVLLQKVFVLHFSTVFTGMLNLSTRILWLVNTRFFTCLLFNFFCYFLFFL